MGDMSGTKDDQTQSFELTAPGTGSLKHFDESGHLYSVPDGSMPEGRTSFEDDCDATTNVSALQRKRLRTASRALPLGDSPRAAALKSLEIEEVAFRYPDSPSMNSRCDLPLKRGPVTS